MVHGYDLKLNKKQDHFNAMGLLWH